MNVDCDNFDASFGSSAITIIIPKAASKFQLIEKASSEFLIENSEGKFDARLKIWRDSNNHKVDHICMDQFGIFFKVGDSKRYKNEKLKAVLDIICSNPTGVME